MGGLGELGLMGQKGKGTRHGCLGRVLIRHGWYARKGSVVDEPESSTGTEGHDVHGMDSPVVAVWSFPGGGVDTTSRGLSLASCPCWFGEVPGGLNHQGLLPLSSTEPQLLSLVLFYQPARTQYGVLAPALGTTHPRLVPWAHRASS